MTITVETELVTDREGNLFVSYVPTLHDWNSGKVQFACFQARVGDSDAIHEAARNNAIKAMRETLAYFAKGSWTS